MSQETENNSQELFTSNNQGFNDSNALQIRLNTEPILRNLEFYLRGYEERVGINNEGDPVVSVVQVALPKANATGVHNIMAWVTSHFNTQVVQGNFENFDRMYDFVADYRIDFTDFLMNNLYDWEISLKDFEGICDQVVSMTKLFLTRLVNDGERRSYTNTIQHKESNSATLDKRGGMQFKIPGFK